MLDPTTPQCQEQNNHNWMLTIFSVLITSRTQRAGEGTDHTFLFHPRCEIAMMDERVPFILEKPESIILDQRYRPWRANL